MNARPGDRGEWLAGPLGQMLLEQERACVGSSLECAFGLHCVQIGAWGEPDAFLAQRAHAPRGAGRDAGHAGAALVAEPSALALQSDSVDVMLLPHTLEFEPDPHEVLREVARVLTGEGELARARLRAARAAGRCANCLHARRLSRPALGARFRDAGCADWLKLLGFEVGRSAALPVRAALARLHDRAARGSLERIGRRRGRGCPAPTCCTRASACIR